jgi:arylsulfatase A-like enzyme
MPTMLTTMPPAILAVLVLTTALAAQGPAKHARPNILLVMTDDQGYGDFSSAGNPVLETPRMDQFAAQCPQVDRFYVSPVCSPTRACLMTGRYNYRTRVVDTWIGRSMMEPTEVTIAEVLKTAGYATGIFGKWHLGDCYPMRPMDQGFDESLVHRGGGLAQPSEPLENERRYTNAILTHNGELTETKGYCTDVYFASAQTFIDASVARKQPFFTYVATNAPHGPFHDVPPALYKKYKQRDMSKVQRSSNPKSAGAKPDVLARTFAMIENVDQNFGRLLDHIEDIGIADNTIVIFMSDNGPVWGRQVAGLRGNKTSVYEGGIRSPLWMRWPGHLDAKTHVKPIAAHIDILPTICDAIGIEPAKGVVLDGRSLMPLLTGKSENWPERALFLQTHRGDAPQEEHHFAVITDQWKLLRHSGFGNEEPKPSDPFELYDLTKDPGELHDVAAHQPDVVDVLRMQYAEWFADVSSTRPNNYRPPRIHVGTVHELVTTLTRQDWRPADGVGWGHKGAWLVHLNEPTKLNVTLIFREQRDLERFTVEAGGKLQSTRMVLTAEPGDRVELGAFQFTKGKVDLRITCDNGTEKFAPYQVLLSRL